MLKDYYTLLYFNFYHGKMNIHFNFVYTYPRGAGEYIEREIGD